MTAEQIQSLLPPIILSIGAILPFLVASPPFSVQERARILLVCLMTLVIWLGYWMAYAFGDRPFVSLGTTGILVALALVVLLVIFFVAQRPEKPGVNGRPARRAPIDNPFWMWAYLLALLILSIAAAFYVGPRDRVIVEIEYLPLDDASPGEIENIEEDTGKGTPVTLDIIEHGRIKHGSKAEIMLTKGEFAAVDNFRVKVNQKSDGKDLNLFAYPARKTELLTPGFGQHYRMRAVADVPR